MDELKAEQLANSFKALAHPIRVKIVAGLIKKKECNVSNMVDNLGVAQPTVSQHLNILKNSGIIKGFREGNQICYKVINEQIINMFSVIE